MRRDRQLARLRADLRARGRGLPEMKIADLRAVAIGDLYIPCEAMREAMTLLSTSHITTLEWRAADEAALQARLLLIEKHGVHAVEPPEEIWENLAQAEFLMTDLCPGTRNMLEFVPQLTFLGLRRSG